MAWAMRSWWGDQHRKKAAMTTSTSLTTFLLALDWGAGRPSLSPGAELGWDRVRAGLGPKFAFCS